MGLGPDDAGKAVEGGIGVAPLSGLMLAMSIEGNQRKSTAHVEASEAVALDGVQRTAEGLPANRGLPMRDALEPGRRPSQDGAKSGGKVQLPAPKFSVDLREVPPAREKHPGKGSSRQRPRKNHPCPPKPSAFVRPPLPPSHGRGRKSRASNSESDGTPESVEIGRKRPHHGKASSEAFKRARNNGESKEAKWKRDVGRLRDRSTKNGTAVVVDLNLMSDANVASTGWQGRKPPMRVRKEIIERYHSGDIREDICHFIRLPFITDRKLSILYLLDVMQRTFLHRGFPAKFISERAPEVAQIVDDLVGDDLRNLKIATPGLTSWHRENSEKVAALLGNDLFQRITKHVRRVVQMAFPSAVIRFEISAKWHEEHHGITPLFGCFWNFCLNGIFPGMDRVHCTPHSDAKNPIGVCAVMVYVLPGFDFNHSQRSWLGIWEAGVVVKLPPWVVLVYPSSLFFHFNIDIHDIEFVTTTGNQVPTPENSRPVVDGDQKGRGSMVWFNMASMFQSSETGFNTLSKARQAGQSGQSDYRARAQEAFLEYGKLHNFPR
ncbi:hypothetical protein BC834DRAFT_975234 [Gloeopeniophorella convolvens]|nr:hypothetical protein BC834DRAFT_975234 [Gloeopeniophorella convolvens]